MTAASTSNGAILAVEQLAKRFGGVVATDDVDLAIRAGDAKARVGRDAHREEEIPAPPRAFRALYGDSQAFAIRRPRRY